jgi:hypothetical protein
MEKRKDSFILYEEYYEPIKMLSTQDKGLLLTALYEYHMTGAIIELPSAAKILFQFIRQRMDYNQQKYREVCERNKANGSKGGRPSNDEREETQKTQSVFSDTKKSDGLFSKPKKADMDMDMDIYKTPHIDSPLNVDNFGDNSAEMDGRKEEKIYIGEDYHVAWDDHFQVELRPLSEGQIGEIDYWLRKHFLGQEIPAHIIRNALITKDQRENKQVANA